MLPVGYALRIQDRYSPYPHGTCLLEEINEKTYICVYYACVCVYKSSQSHMCLEEK